SARGGSSGCESPGRAGRRPSRPPRRGRPPSHGAAAGRPPAPPPTSRGPIPARRALLPWPPRGCGSCPGLPSWRGGSSYSRPAQVETGEEVVRGQVLERGEAGAEHAHLLDRGQRAVTIERGYGLAQSEVARGPGVRPGEVAGEEPVGRPFAESSD